VDWYPHGWRRRSGAQFEEVSLARFSPRGMSYNVTGNQIPKIRRDMAQQKLSAKRNSTLSL
jgi:hypothetical protein